MNIEFLKKYTGKLDENFLKYLDEIVDKLNFNFTNIKDREGIREEDYAYTYNAPAVTISSGGIEEVISISRKFQGGLFYSSGSIFLSASDTPTGNVSIILYGGNVAMETITFIPTTTEQQYVVFNFFKLKEVDKFSIKVQNNSGVNVVVRNKKLCVWKIY